MPLPADLRPPGRLAEALGWVGATAIFSAYFLVSFSVLSPSGPAFQALNGLGAAAVAYVSFRRQALQPAVLNAVWFLVALWAGLRLLF